MKEQPVPEQELNENAPEANEANESAPAAQSAPDPLAALQSEMEKFRDLALRSQADLENYRKKVERERAETTRFANASFLEKLLPIVDNFSHGLKAAQQARDADAILQGMNMVYQQMEQFLRDCGVQVVKTENTPFDPNLHEAISHENDPEIAEGYIVSEVTRGYLYHDRLLRAARVIVSRGPEEEASPS